ncbi:aa3-type cytochrome c oxidase subunit IV [Rhodobaculum claviforme]|uniref:Aa3-type cytochrome c oxidase subunit IV n=1 Tax=Rhodobaculum claviforme TaxID=1549854 RepID=A0A934WKV1_9RHOB|nr:aa3-type cytochrome c oxidase subunit IV [Rhodobaculum claviforme]MBK5928933.1 aa3-type cytochrome c oxidase subunit IV [Rhodobaculum claviforme]
MAKHKHGEMDVTEQEKTFGGFLKFAAWTAAICVGLLIFVALLNA